MTASARRSARIAAGLRTVPLRRAVLVALSYGPRTTRELAADLGVPVEAIQPQISSLVSSELVDFISGPQPRVWAITTAGAAALERLRAEGRAS